MECDVSPENKQTVTPQHFNEPLVFDMEVRDLSPRKDPKGGSPKTPIPISVSELKKQSEDGIVWTAVEHSNGIWRAIAGALGGAMLGMTVAWFTALQSHGMNQKEVEELIRDSQLEQEKHLLSRQEMQTYVKENTPWSFDKQAIISRLSSQDQQIGALQQKIDLATRIIETQRGTPIKP